MGSGQSFLAVMPESGMWMGAKIVIYKELEAKCYAAFRNRLLEAFQQSFEFVILFIIHVKHATSVGSDALPRSARGVEGSP